jgi:hypothetical protein
MNFQNTGQSGNPFGSSQSVFNRGENFKKYGYSRSGDNENGAFLRDLSAYNFGPAASRNAFNAGMENDYQKTLETILNGLRNSNPAMQAQRAGNATRAQYGQAQGYADQSARAQGLGAGAQLGNQQGLQSQAARAGAAAQAPYLDPQWKRNQLMQALGLMAQSQESNPYLDQIMQAFAPIEGRSQANAAARAQRGIGGIAGNILGQYLSSMSGGGMAPVMPGTGGPPGGGQGTISDTQKRDLAALLQSMGLGAG